MVVQIGFAVFVLASVIFQFPKASATPNQCPCVFNITTGTADCQYKYVFRKLEKIPNCVPNTTRTLIFRNNDLTYQPGQLQRFKFLTCLDLSLNYKFSPKCDSFDGLARLKLLDLSYTNLEHFKPCLSAKLNTLETLRMSGSKMRHLTADFFGALNNLTFLDISDNALPEISNNIFTSLKNLKHLNLGYNVGLVLNVHSFLGLSNLRSLKLDFSTMPNGTSFPISVFRPLEQIVEINLAAVCSSLDKYYNCEAIDQRLRAIPTLKMLTLDNFVINSLGLGFATLTHLKELSFGTYLQTSLSTCNISTLSNKTFQSLRNSPIRKITIAWCKITQIQPFTFFMFRNLTYLE